MEDRTFELIQKLYSEFTEFRKETNERFSRHDEKFEGLNDKFEGLDKEVKSLKRIVLRIENDHGQKLDALFDGYKLTYEKVSVIEEKLIIMNKEYKY